MKSRNISCFAVLLIFVCPDVFGESDKTIAAQQAAVEWLALVDASEYESSWNDTAASFKSLVESSEWTQALTKTRKPLGAAVSRELIAAKYVTSLPGALDGEYVVIQFKTEFEAKSQAVETVTPMLDEGQWKVSGYYIK